MFRIAELEKAVIVAVFLSCNTAACPAKPKQGISADLPREQYNRRIENSPWFATLKAAMSEADPRKAESLFQHARTQASETEEPYGIGMCEFQHALYRYSWKKYREGDSSLDRSWLAIMNSPGDKLANFESLGNMCSNAAEMWQISGHGTDVSEKLLRKRVELTKKFASKYPEFKDITPDRLLRPAWEDLLSLYAQEGKEKEASEIWKLYPDLESKYRRIRQAASNPRFPLRP